MNCTKMKKLFRKGTLSILLLGVITFFTYRSQPKQIVDPVKDYMKSLVLKYRTGRSGKLRIINLSVMGDTLKNQKIIYM